MSRTPEKSVRLDEAIERFLSALAGEGLAKATIETKKRTLTVLTQAVGRVNRSTRKLKPEDFEATLTLLATGLTPAETAQYRAEGKKLPVLRVPSSLNMDRTALRQFADYLKHRGWVKASFDAEYRITKSARDAGDQDPDKIRRFRSVAEEDWPKLLGAAGLHHPRSRMIVAVGLFWGRRVSEIAYIRFRHINLDRNEVELFNIKKGRAAGTDLPISEWMRSELDRYLAWYREHYGEPQPDGYLVPAKLPLTDPRVTNLLDTQAWPVDPTRPARIKEIIKDIKTALWEMGWTDEMLYGEGGHTLRRSAAIATSTEAGDEAAMALLDHKTPGSLHRYTHNSAGAAALRRSMSTQAPPQPTPDPAPVKAPEVVEEANVVKMSDFLARRRRAS